MVTIKYTKYRVRSVTRPKLIDGLPDAVFFSPMYRTKQEVDALNAKTVGFYLDGPNMEKRGAEREDEEFILQVYGTDGNWIDVGSIKPLPGKDPAIVDE